jgi:hypothetical protein
MVVADDDRHSIAPHSFFENLTHAHLRGVHRAATDRFDTQYLVADIQHNHMQFLLLQCAHAELNQGSGISRAVYGGQLIRRFYTQPVP